MSVTVETAIAPATGEHLCIWLQDLFDRWTDSEISELLPEARVSGQHGRNLRLPLCELLSVAGVQRLELGWRWIGWVGWLRKRTLRAVYYRWFGMRWNRTYPWRHLRWMSLTYTEAIVQGFCRDIPRCYLSTMGTQPLVKVVDKSRSEGYQVMPWREARAYQKSLRRGR